MSPLTIGVLAVSMSIDAFIAALGRGAVMQRPNLSTALRTGAVFGGIEAITPLIGWAMGMAASRYVAAVDHWIAFALLGSVGLHMMTQALNRQAGQVAPPASFWRLVATAVGTSIDAMAVGVSLAFLDVNILVIAAAIGVATMMMSAMGLMTGRFLGHRFGKVIEVIGGLALIGLGATILYEHLSAG
ncbi:MAG TPA: manganese efflux pump MntP family protein [Paenirhodobacter sp.]